MCVNWDQTQKVSTAHPFCALCRGANLAYAVGMANTHIYKILTAGQWAAFEANGQFDGAPIDIADGYIHFSDASQVAETAAKHFAGQSGLMLAAVQTAAVEADLKWEVSRGGALFPHLYRALVLDDIAWCKPLVLDGHGHHVLPSEVGQ